MGMELRKREIGQGVLFVSLVLLVVLLATHAKRREVPHTEPATTSDVQSVAVVTPAPTLRSFDPNTAHYEELLALGMSRAEAVSLLKFRASGKVFRIRAVDMPRQINAAQHGLHHIYLGVMSVRK